MQKQLSHFSDFDIFTERKSVDSVDCGCLSSVMLLCALFFKFLLRTSIKTCEAENR